MAELTVSKVRFANGLWEGLVSRQGGAGDQPPELEAVVHITPAFGAETSELPVPEVAVTPIPGSPDNWRLEVSVPSVALGDGLRTVMIREAGSGVLLAGFAIVSGPQLDGDALAELALMRAELDMLKAAFRRLATQG